MFTIGILITIAVRTAADEITADDVEIAVVLLPAALIGFLLSRSLTGRVEGALLRNLVVTISALAAIGVVVKALV